MKKPFYYLLLFCLSFILYIQTISFDFVDFDDVVILKENSDFFEKDVAFSKFFTTDAFLDDGGEENSAFYRPLQNISFWIDVQLAGGKVPKKNPWAFHLTNVLLFSLLICALFKFLSLFKVPTKLAFWGALIFLVHPLFSFPVSWIPARGDLMLTLFALLSFSTFIKFIETKKIVYFIGTFLLFSLALFTKETAIVLPVIYLIYFYLQQNDHKLRPSYFVLGALFLIVGTFWFILRINATDINPNGTSWEHFLYNFQYIPTAISQFFLPWEFAPMPSFSVAKTFAGLVILVLLIYLPIKYKLVSWKIMTFCGIWFLLFIMPTFLHYSMHSDYLDHRFILPDVGLLLFSLLILTKFWNKNHTKMIQLGMLSVIIVFCVISLYKIPFNANHNVFVEECLSYNPKSAISYYKRGKLKEQKGDILGAITDYSTAIKWNNKHFLFYSDKGNLQVITEKFKEAIPTLDTAILLFDGCDVNYINRGFSYYKLSNYDKSIENYEQALRCIVSNSVMRYNAFLGLAYSYQELKEYEKAIQYCDSGIKVLPDHTYAPIQKQLIIDLLLQK